MRKVLIPLLFIPVAAAMCGCSMFSAWKSIPPPGGCDQCHTLPISNDWQVSYKPPVLTSERRVGESFQSEEYTVSQGSRATSSLDLRKMEDLQCFDCHKSPNSAHKMRQGRFHH